MILVTGRRRNDQQSRFRSPPGKERCAPDRCFYTISFAPIKRRAANTAGATRRGNNYRTMGGAISPTPPANWTYFSIASTASCVRNYRLGYTNPRAPQTPIGRAKVKVSGKYQVATASLPYAAHISFCSTCAQASTIKDAPSRGCGRCCKWRGTPPPQERFGTH